MDCRPLDWVRADGPPGAVYILERELQRELHLSWIARVFDFPEISSVADVAIRIQKLRMVKDVKELGAEFEVLAFSKRRDLLHGEVEIVDPRSAAESTW